MSCDRREFISQTALAAAALVLCGACGSSDGPTPPATVTSFIKVSDYPALANVNGVALVSLNGASLAIVRTGAATFVALSRVCPHQGGRIDQQGTGFKCSRHGAEFTLTGTWRGGQQTSNMRSYPTTYDAAAGTLTIG